MKYTDVNGVERTLTRYQAEVLLMFSSRIHHPVKEPWSVRLLEERGLLTTQVWHCPLDPRCITGLTGLGVAVLRDLKARRQPTK